MIAREEIVSQMEQAMSSLCLASLFGKAVCFSEVTKSE
jgi:hypothetical protein